MGFKKTLVTALSSFVIAGTVFSSGVYAQSTPEAPINSPNTITSILTQTNHSKTTDQAASNDSHVKYLSEKYFFNYDSGKSVLDALEINSEMFISKAVDTRNWYSHYFVGSKKPNKLKEGFEIAFFYSQFVGNEFIYLV